MDTKPASDLFRYNNMVFNKNLEGISHEDSILLTPSLTSTINWVVGHVIQSRTDMLKELGTEKIFDKDIEGAYARGTRPDNGKAMDLARLKELFASSQETLNEAFGNADTFTADHLQTAIFFGFHEAYHMGQLGTLRRLAGKESAIK